MTDRITVREWIKGLRSKPPTKGRDAETLRVFAEGTERVERENPRAPRRFRPFEWGRIFDGWLPVFLSWNRRTAH